VTLSRKRAKSRRRITGLRSKTTKARTHVDRLRAANADLKKKLAEALDQRAATSEVLGVISSSPGELASVFQAMLENAIASRKCTTSSVLNTTGNLRGYPPPEPWRRVNQAARPPTGAGRAGSPIVSNAEARM
jgi:hypothetical protein